MEIMAPASVCKVDGQTEDADAELDAILLDSAAML
jgi:hypothetical protein